MSSKENTSLISWIHFTYKFEIPDTKTTQNNFFFFLYFGQCSLDFNKLGIKAKMHAKTFFFGVWKTQYDFLALRHLTVYTKTFFQNFLLFFSWQKPGVLIPNLYFYSVKI
jgi:hypothetical protein